MERHVMGSISGYTVFAVVVIIGAAWLSRIVRIATEQEMAKKRDIE